MGLPILLNYLQSPAHKSFVNFDGHPNGDAMDLGWRNKYNNPNQPLYSLGEMQVLGAQYFKDAGNNIALGAQYDNERDVWVATGHMQYAAIVKVGDILTRSSQMGNMGDSGKSFGAHAHIRMCFVPKGTPFIWDALFNAPRVNPYDYIYTTPEMDVLDMKAMPNDWASITDDDSLVRQDGKFTVTFADGLNVRKKPSVNSERVTGLSKGQSVIYDNYIDEEGYRWVSWIHEGIRVYGARRKLDNSEIYGDAEFLSKEPSRPVSDVGKSWTPKSFPLKLYPQSTGGTNYGDSNGDRSYTILSEANGRVQIQHKLFDAPQNKVWVTKSDGKVG
ncbi:M23 family metallopeptidase [Erysipelothrix sp. HDW6A]|uniref:SH3 domain-containing protein n=1 Tax=Erysipelothrix sp. HDW6A TaxID=2714928 RepID=UPI00140745E5|nr:SH3 domain-containing protein [Erysipelothrix sp. HDW6A]QIK57759.1 M23 family metallopeptidase [Erysipelothrix sp. HDW6A]